MIILAQKATLSFSTNLQTAPQYLLPQGDEVSDEFNNVHART